MCDGFIIATVIMEESDLANIIAKELYELELIDNQEDKDEGH